MTEMLGLVSDVSPLERANQRVHESEQALAGRVEVLEAILETAGEGILVVDDRAQIIVANPLARDVSTSFVEGASTWIACTKRAV